MPNVSRKAIHSYAKTRGANEEFLRVRIRALEMPPIKDGLVIGRDAAIGGEAMSRTLRLMTNVKFDRIAVRDEIIQELIVRSAILRKLGRARLLKFVLERVKPIMAETDLLMLDMEVELVIEDSI